MEALEELLQQALEDGCPTIVDIIKEAIAALPTGEMTDVVLKAHLIVDIIEDAIAALPTGEMTDVLVKAHLVDPDLANVLTGICLEMLVEQAIANEGILSIQ